MGHVVHVTRGCCIGTVAGHLGADAGTVYRCEGCGTERVFGHVTGSGVELGHAGAYN